MKMAVELNKEIKEKIIEDLQKREWYIDFNSFGTMWIYEIRSISYSNNSIILQRNDLKEYRILLKDVNYLEIQEEE